MIRQIATWSFAAAGSAYGAFIVAKTETPIDAALPFIVVVMTALAAVTHPAVQLSVPLLIAVEIGVADERLRLLCFGIVLAVSFAGSISIVRNRSQAASITVAGVVLLRWLPFSEVLIGREIFILAVAVAVAVILGSTPLAIAVGLAGALFTPAIPLRTLAIPVGVLMVAMVARAFGADRFRLFLPSTAAVALMMTFFAWSGAFARAMPVLLRGGPPSLQRSPLQIALAPGQTADVEVPVGGRGLILSGANVPRLRKGTVVGSIEPGHIVVRIGDIADWGALRREHYYRSRNPLPRRPGGIVRGYGQTAWIDASGRIALPAGRVRVTADARLPHDASLQIDAVELGR